VRSLADALLYAIIDFGYVSAENAPAILEKFVAGRIDLVQLRGKNRSLDELSVLAERLLQLTKPAKIPLIANDHAEMAQRVEVQGVHVGQDDDSIEKVRAQIKRPIVVGKSTHSIEQAGRRRARRRGLHRLRPNLLHSHQTGLLACLVSRTFAKCTSEFPFPFFASAVIKLENLPQVIAAGAKRVVIVSGLLQANDIAEYARACKRLLSQQRDHVATDL